MTSSNTLILTSELPPSVNHYLKYKIVRRGNRVFPSSYQSPESIKYKRKFKKYVKEQIKIQGWKVPEKDKLVYIYIEFYMDRKRKDPNNFFKVPLDALSEAGVYLDDDIALPVTTRLYIDSKNPRMEMKLVESEAIGVFNDREHLNEFTINNCINCRRDMNTCGIRKKLLENRIVEEVNNDNCMKKKPK